MSPDKQINKTVGETNNLLKYIRVAFAYVDEGIARKILVSLIRSRSEYAVVLWSPSTKKNTK